MRGAWCDPTDLDPIFRLRATRVLNRNGYLRFRHWRLYGERGLAGERAAVWVHDAMLTVEYAAETLAQYRVILDEDGHRLREVTEPRLYPTGHRSPQPFLPLFDTLAWTPARQLVPDRPRRRSAAIAVQETLFTPEQEAAASRPTRPRPLLDGHRFCPPVSTT